MRAPPADDRVVVVDGGGRGCAGIPVREAAELEQAQRPACEQERPPRAALARAERADDVAEVVEAGGDRARAGRTDVDDRVSGARSSRAARAQRRSDEREQNGDDDRDRPAH
jgi:hypothetical protein